MCIGILRDRVKQKVGRNFGWEATRTQDLYAARAYLLQSRAPCISTCAFALTRDTSNRGENGQAKTASDLTPGSAVGQGDSENDIAVPSPIRQGITEYFLVSFMWARAFSVHISEA